MARLANIAGLSIHANVFQIHGSGLSRTAIGNIDPVSSIEALRAPKRIPFRSKSGRIAMRFRLHKRPSARGLLARPMGRRNGSRLPVFPARQPRPYFRINEQMATLLHARPHKEIVRTQLHSLRHHLSRLLFSKPETPPISPYLAGAFDMALYCAAACGLETPFSGAIILRSSRLSLEGQRQKQCGAKGIFFTS